MGLLDVEVATSAGIPATSACEASTNEPGPSCGFCYIIPYTTDMLWLKALHLIFMVTWFAGLFYLPRLFVYHAMSDDNISLQRFCIMERKLLWGIATPGGVLTLVFGFWLLSYNPELLLASWMQAKLILIGTLAGFHVWCARLQRQFALWEQPSRACLPFRLSRDE